MSCNSARSISNKDISENPSLKDKEKALISALIADGEDDQQSDIQEIIEVTEMIKDNPEGRIINILKRFTTFKKYI